MWNARLFTTDTEVWADDTWLIDSTPVECGRSRPTTQRSNLAGVAGYGYCASHSRWFWGLRLHLVCTPAGLPITFALTNPKVDERDVAIDLFEPEPALFGGRRGQTVIADKGYASAEFERRLAEHRVELIRPALANQPRRRGASQLRRLRQVIESINNTLKAPAQPRKITADTALKESSFASSNGSSLSPPRSGTTTTPVDPSCAR